MKIAIWSSSEAASSTLPYPYALVSISCAQCGPEWPLADDPNRKAVLRLTFHDHRGDVMVGDHAMPIPDDVKAVMPFVEEWREKVEGLAFNCGAGHSRSAGVASGVCARLGLDDAECFKEPRNPNLLVRGFVIEG